MSNWFLLSQCDDLRVCLINHRLKDLILSMLVMVFKLQLCPAKLLYCDKMLSKLWLQYVMKIPVNKLAYS